jgi:serine/threonine protein kinase
MDNTGQNADWNKIKEIFSLALEKERDQRLAFVAEICANDDHLRAEVESWLASYEAAEKFIEKPAFEVSSTFAEKDQIAKHFGSYRIIREIGAGGMGAVFLAERDDGEFSQQVAIKIIRQAIAESEIISRFKRERQILADLNHPNIARLLDGGVSNDGLPFLAMEFVEGEAITKFAARENLSLEDRLKLFLKVCSAVTYAHRNLVIHRDLKPSNILVTDEIEPKLLDFGLAKLLDENLLNTGAQETQTAFRALTPAYASPEQLKGETLTTASDIYSLGVILYELLTGERPFQFEGKSLEEIIKTVTQTEPLAPSAVSSSKSQVPDRKFKNKAAPNDEQKENPKSEIRNPKSLKGDLDNIILMSLRKEPARRYQSVEQFAEDIERYLKGLPVSARPNTFKYRASKFITRHKVGVAAVSLVLLSLIGGIVVSLSQARIARREKAKAEVVNDFLQSILQYSDPNMNSPTEKRSQMTVKDVLDAASKRLKDEDLSNPPEIRAELQRIIGTSYLSQGEYELARQNLTSALDAETQYYGENSPETLKILVSLGELYVQISDIENAEKIYRQRIAILRSEQKKGNISADLLLSALNDFALIRRKQGFSKEAETILLEALALRGQISPEAKNLFGTVEAIYALTLSDRGQFDEAINIVRPKVEEIKKQENSETPELCANLTALGSFQMEKGELAEAEKNLVEAGNLYRKLFSSTSIPLGDNLRLQAQFFYLQGNLPEAEKKINEALKIYRESSQTHYINYPAALIIQGLILNKKNQSATAEPILREALKIRTDTLPKGHFWVSIAEGALGECLMTQKKFAESEPFLLESYENLKLSQGTDTPRTILAKSRLAMLYEKTNRQASANPYR